MSKKLAIAKPSSAAILSLPPTAPPPRKEDIINAMVERARVKHEEEKRKLEVQREAALKELNAALLLELKNKPDSFTIHFHSQYHCPEIEYVLDVVPPHIHKLREKLKSVPSIRFFDAAEVRRKIREQFTGAATDRVKSLLSNPEAVAALDAALEKIQ